MLLRVPGARSSLGFPGTVTRPILESCLNWRWLPFVATRRQPSSCSIRSTSPTFTRPAYQEPVSSVRPRRYCGITAAVTGRGERMRASGPVDCVVIRRSQAKRRHGLTDTKSSSATGRMSRALSVSSAAVLPDAPASGCRSTRRRHGRRTESRPRPPRSAADRAQRERSSPYPLTCPSRARVAQHIRSAANGRSHRPGRATRAPGRCTASLCGRARSR